MAGHRRARARRAGAELEPTQRASRLTRRRERMAARFAQAGTAVERLTVAHDYLRGAAARRQPRHGRVEQLLDDLCRRLIAAGDQLLAWQATERTETRTTTRKDHP